MQLSEEEKKSLKEKYRQQRRAMWSGKRASDDSGELELEEVAPPEAEPDMTDHHGPENNKHQDSTSSAFSTDPGIETSVTAQVETHVEIADDATHQNESASQRTSQHPTTDDSDSREVHQLEQIATEVNAPTSDATRLVEKIREQREEMCEETSSIRPRPEKRRRNSEKADLKSLRGSEDGGEPAMLTWKLVLGVFGAIIVLVSIGIMLGIWFAS